MRVTRYYRRTPAGIVECGRRTRRRITWWVEWRVPDLSGWRRMTMRDDGTPRQEAQVTTRAWEEAAVATNLFRLTRNEWGRLDEPSRRSLNRWWPARVVRDLTGPLIERCCLAPAEADEIRRQFELIQRGAGRSLDHVHPLLNQAIEARNLNHFYGGGVVGPLDRMDPRTFAAYHLVGELIGEAERVESQTNRPPSQPMPPPSRAAQRAKEFAFGADPR